MHIAISLLSILYTALLLNNVSHTTRSLNKQHGYWKIQVSYLYNYNLDRKSSEVIHNNYGCDIIMGTAETHIFIYGMFI